MMAKSNPGGGGTDNSKKYGDILSNGMKVGKTYSSKTYKMLKPMTKVRKPFKLQKKYTKKLKTK